MTVLITEDDPADDREWARGANAAGEYARTRNGCTSCTGRGTREP